MRRLFAAVLLILALAQPATAQSSLFLSREAEARIGAEEHPKVLAQFGGALAGPQADYLRELGSRLAAHSERPDGPWTFTLLNTDVINAFALPGGYVYITRGIMALAADEAELAGIVGHEMGHVVARHSAQRFDRQLGAQIGSVAAEILGQVFLGVRGGGQIAGLAGQAYIAGFSREQELEADTYGVRYLRAAGYDTAAMGSFLARMGEWDRLEAAIAGRRAGDDQFSWFSTHPRTPERVQAAVAAAGGSQAGDRAREAHIRRIDGMVWGDDTDEGVIRGRTFLHPVLRFRFDVPEGFRLVNGTRAVTATHSGGGQIIFDAGQIRGDAPPDQYLTRGWATNARLTGLETLDVGGMPAAVARTRLSTRQGPMDLLLVAVRHAPGRYWRFQLASAPQRTASFLPGFRATLGSFRVLSAAEAGAIRPLRVRAHRVRPGETVARLARAMPVERAEERFRVMNALGPDEPVQAGQWVKLIAE
ncbi:M48 family metalloprotease [Elioraea sp.]|uniref:M48 family metalloprotease n=1 Tax=Elioraea sp. TaxID=2185103 RepID=UPI003F723E33